MTDPDIRTEVVDLLVDQYDYGVTHTAEQLALIASATDAERHVAAEAWRVAWDSQYRWIAGQATPEEAKLHETTWTLSSSFEGLPASAGFVLLVHFKWPDWDQKTRDLARPVFAEWSDEDRQRLEERFGIICYDGFHWDA
jgi:hypothetical protein